MTAEAGTAGAPRRRKRRKRAAQTEDFVEVPIQLVPADPNALQPSEPDQADKDPVAPTAEDAAQQDDEPRAPFFMVVPEWIVEDLVGEAIA